MLSRSRGHFHGHPTKEIGPSVRFLQLNCEGISGSESEYISPLAREESVDIVCLQELHVGDINQLNYRVKIERFKIATYILSNIHGSAILVKHNIMDFLPCLSPPP
ncbi:hypothetical protein JTB14_012603 [Gonioctena quinquepunctata]|nr:hypothetical protein JTB14_012603 [Gonioctena quinquepunctata]